MGKTVKSNTSEFIAKSIAKFGDKFNYSNTIYTNRDTKLYIKCVEHDLEFSIFPASHLKKYGGCPACLKLSVRNRFSSSKEDFIEKAFSVHGNKYDYSKSKYINQYKEIIIHCKEHDISFEQKPANHIFLKCSNCTFCSGRVKSTKDFKLQAIKTHGALYNYDKSVYITSVEPLEIFCNKCKNVFFQSSTKHVNSKHGCPKCANNSNISKLEIQWLDSILIPDDKWHRQVYFNISGFKFRADGFDPINNTVYLFHGDYWHGNPIRFNPNEMNEKVKKTYKQLYDETLSVESNIRANGFNLIVKWEFDYLKDLENGI